MKLIASDFDGTLYFYRETPSIRIDDQKAIKDFQKQGHVFGICTGRHYDGINDFVKGLIDLDFYILNNGSLILDRDAHVIYRQTIPVDEVRTILDHFDLESMVVTDQKVYLYKNSRNWNDPQFQHITSYDEITETDIQSFSFHLDDIDETKRVVDEINQMNLSIIAFQNKCDIDCIHKDCSKGHGIQIIQDYYQLNDDEIYGIGDSYNDIPMLKQCQTSFTFKDSPRSVQEQTQYLVDNIKECINIVLKR